MTKYSIFASRHNRQVSLRLASYRYISLGQVTSGPEFSGDTLRIVYTNGDVCSSNKTRKYSTVITFRCDSNAAVRSLPVVVETEESCTVQMLWVTKAACAIGQSDSESMPSSPCTVTNPASQHVFNLSSLASSTFYDVYGSGKHSYHINICKKVVDTQCSGNTGTKLQSASFVLCAMQLPDYNAVT